MKRARDIDLMFAGFLMGVALTLAAVFMLEHRGCDNSANYPTWLQCEEQ